MVNRADQPEGVHRSYPANANRFSKRSSQAGICLRKVLGAGPGDFALVLIIQTGIC